MMETEEKYKVVIVDDERTAIDALRRELEPYREFEVKGIAGNGAKGKKMIMELHPDLLFLDVELPDTLGLNLLSEIREDILWDMKVVFYTSYDKYLLQALRESAFDFLLKPFEAEDLKVIMDRYRKAMSSTSLPLLPSFASSISALMPQQGMFMISTVTGFKLLRLEEIGFFEYLLKSATKLFSVLLASKRPLITELADKLRLKYPLLPTISPCPTMRLEAIRSIIPISCRRYPKSV